jgi:hypothetical protein
MKKTKDLLFYFYMLFFALSACLFFTAIDAYALNEAGSASNSIGEFKTIKGKAELLRGGKKISLKVGESLKLLDIAETEADSEALVILNDNSLIVLGGPLKSKLVAKKYMLPGMKEEESVLSIPFGEMRGITCGEKKVEIETHVADVYSAGASDFVVWESTIDGKPASCLAVLKGAAELKNSEDPATNSVQVSRGLMSCVTAGGVPSSPVPIPEELLNVLLAKGEKAYLAHACQEPCTQCERLNPQGVCVPDNLKPCDDGNSCTIDDRCLGRECKGKKDPSPVDPNCS